MPYDSLSSSSWPAHLLIFQHSPSPHICFDLLWFKCAKSSSLPITLWTSFHLAANNPYLPIQPPLFSNFLSLASAYSPNPLSIFLLLTSFRHKGSIAPSFLQSSFALLPSPLIQPQHIIQPTHPLLNLTSALLSLSLYLTEVLAFSVLSPTPEHAYSRSIFRVKLNSSWDCYQLIIHGDNSC